jgi:hypothetical protein
MMANGTWTEAHAKRQSELNAIANEYLRAYRASLSVEKKEARRARNRNHVRVHMHHNRDAVNAARRHRYANKKLDPIKYEAYRQKCRQKDNERYRKRTLELKAERVRTRARTSADDDDDDEDEKSTDVQIQSVIPGDNVIVISDDETCSCRGRRTIPAAADVEGIAFVSSDDEHEQ